MKIIPHDYQVAAIDAVRGHIVAGRRRVVLVAPTGAGKTTVAAEIIHAAMLKGSSVLFLAHRSELIEQASERLDLYGIDHGIIKAGTTRAKRSALVQVASVQSLLRRELPPAGIVIIDECHRAKAKSYQRIVAAYPQAVTIGLTATPWRLDGSGLGDLFDEMVQVCQPRYLIERDPAVLVKPRVFAPVMPDLSKVKTSKGDFEAAALEELMATEASIAEIVRNWHKHGAGRMTVCFATSVKHSLMIRDAFRASGVTAEHVDGSTHPDDRKRILADFRAGRIDVLSNCEVLIEGWDCPPTSCAILARPTKSLTIYLQAVGRVLRAAPGKADAVLLDHAGLHAIHGFATDDREWDLMGKPKKQAEAAVKNCPMCFACVPSACGKCPECGHTFAVVSAAPAEKTAADRDLVEVLDAPPVLEPRDRWLLALWRPRDQRPEDYTQTVYDALAAHCLKKGFKPGWIRHKFAQIVGKQPSSRVMYASRYAGQLDALKAPWTKPAGEEVAS